MRGCMWHDSLLPIPKPFPQRPTRYSFRRPIYILVTDFTRTIPGSVGLVSRFGQFYKSVDPGLVQVKFPQEQIHDTNLTLFAFPCLLVALFLKVNVCTESLRVVDVKIQISAIGRQTVM